MTRHTATYILRRMARTLAAAMGLWLVSCSTDYGTPAFALRNGSASAIDVDAGIDAGVMSRGAITATTFGYGSTLGLFVCRADRPGQYVQFADNTLNMCVTRTNSNQTRWSYRFEKNYPNGRASNELYIIADSTDLHNADFYAYAPYQKGITDLHTIPFSLNTATLGGQPDIMWAEQNADPIVNKDMQPGDGLPNANGEPVMKVRFDFHHALSMLNLQFRVDSHSNSAGITISKICISKGKGRKLPFYMTGTMDAFTGVLTPGSEVESIEYESGAVITAVESGGVKHYNDVPVLMYPSAADDAGIAAADVLLHMHIHIQIRNIEYAKYEFDITRDMLTHSDGTTVGFRQGYKYSFKFKIDNYLYLDGIEIERDWRAGVQPPEVII